MFEFWLKSMMKAALRAQAEMGGFNVADPATDFFVNRAYTNITARSRTREEQYRGAVRAVTDAGAFLARIERHTRSKSFLVESSASDAVKQLTTDCIYPWCKDLP